MFLKKKLVFFEGSIPGGCVFGILLFFQKKRKTTSAKNTKINEKRHQPNPPFYAHFVSCLVSYPVSYSSIMFHTMCSMFQSTFQTVSYCVSNSLIVVHTVVMDLARSQGLRARVWNMVWNRITSTTRRPRTVPKRMFHSMKRYETPMVKRPCLN